MENEVVDICKEHGWEWQYQEEYNTWNLMNGNEMLCYITKRPDYCDRGNYLGQMDIGGLDNGDCWPNFYMKLETAKGEMTLFLRWRLYKIKT